MKTYADVIRTAAEGGHSDADVARLLGVNITTVRRAAAELGVELADGSCRIVQVAAPGLERGPRVAVEVGGE